MGNGKRGKPREDITESKRAEEAPRQPKEFHESIVQNMGEGVVVEDAQGYITFVNSAAAALFGYDAEELVGQHWTVIIPTDKQPIVKAADERRARGESDHYEVEIVRKDGARLSVIVHGSPRFEEEKFVGTIALFMDITERKQAEEALRESEAKYRSLAESLDELIYRADPETFVATYVNNAIVRIYGYTVEEWLSDPKLWESTIHPDDKERAFAELIEAQKKLQSAVIEYRIIRKDNTVRWVEDHVSWEKDQRGNVVSVSGVLYDITGRKRAEEEAQRRLARLQALREIDRAISSSLELGDRLDVLLDKLTDLPHIDGASVMVLEPDTKELKTVAIHNLSEELARTAEARLKEGLPRLVVEQEKPLAITDLMTNERVVYRDLYRRGELASYIGLPLLAKGELIGVLGVYSRERHRWSQEQSDFLHTLAGQAAIAVDNAALYDEVLRRLQTIEAMREIDRTVLSGLTLKEVTEAIATSIGRLIPYDRASIAILEDGTFAIVASLANGQVAIPKEAKISAAETFLSQVVAGQHPVYRPDIASREHLYRYDKQLLDEGIASDLIIPLIARGKVLGTLNLCRYQRNGFDKKAISLTEDLARPLAIAIDNALAYQRLKELNLQTITALSTAMGAKDPYTQDHSANVTRLAVAIAQRMGLSEEEIENLRVAGLLHDMGKIGIPGAVLNKPARLTSAEFTMIREHPVIAANLVDKIGPLSGSVPAIRHHHERYDGQGYPDGLQGEEIPLLARIMAVADGYDAMTSERPYRRAKTQEETLAELKAGAGPQWDPKVVEVFVKICEEGALKH